MKKFIILMFISIILSFSVFAGTSWIDDGNAGFKGAGNGGRGLYSGYGLNTGFVANYSTCSISTGTIFEPIAYDALNTGLAQFMIISQSNGIFLYDMNCNYIEQITTLVPDRMPALTNLNRNAYQEVTFVSNSRIYVFELQAVANPAMIVNASIGFSPEIFACGKSPTSNDITLDQVCFIDTTDFSSGSFHSAFEIIDFSQGTNFAFGLYTTPTLFKTNTTYTNLSGAINTNFVISLQNTSLSDSTVYPSSTGFGLIPVCLQSVYTGSGKTRCEIYKSDGTIYSVFNLTNSNAYGSLATLSSAKVSALYYVSSIASILNNEILIFEITLVGGTATTRQAFYATSSLTGTGQKTYEDITTATTSVSNLMVGNFDKSNYNYICQADVTNPSSSNSKINCYDNLGNVISSWNISNTTVSSASGGVGWNLGDYGQANKLCWMNKNGIFCIDTTTNRSYSIYSSGLATSTVPSYNNGKQDDITNDRSIIVQMPNNGVPMAAYIQPDNIYVFTPNTSTFICGDGVCNGFENAFTCPADCLINSSCLTTDPSYICKPTCPSQYLQINGLSCDSVNSNYVCCAPSESQGCTIANYLACPRLNATCTINTNTSISSDLCNTPYLVNGTIYCASTPYDCIANGFAGCAFGACYTAQCYSDNDCLSHPGFPTCLQGQCVAGFSGQACSDNSDCFNQLNASICVNFVCVAGVFNSTFAPGNQQKNINPMTNPGDIWSLLLGGGLWKIFIGIIVLLIFIGDVNLFVNPFGDPVLTVIISAAALALFTTIQLINTWISIVIILLAGSLFLIKVFMFGKGQGE